MTHLYAFRLADYCTVFKDYYGIVFSFIYLIPFTSSTGCKPSSCGL
jgi:hypothetical protein